MVADLFSSISRKIDSPAEASLQESKMSALPSMSVDRPFAAIPLRPREYGLLLAQLLLSTVLTWQFHLEDQRHLQTALLIATLGFAVHAVLPVRYRRAWFVFGTVVAMTVVLGPLQAAYGLAIAAVLIGVVAGPFPNWLRIGVIIALASGCVWSRNGSKEMFWPIIGSMFMFRLFVYLQTVRHERRPVSRLDICSYFLMFPNVFFPLYPVIDYRTFRETYYNEDCRKIYQTGVHWIAVGIGHLLIYRVLKYELLPMPLEIRTYRGVALFLAANYALYVRVSGHFHIICGMLHLFGFNLPRTHDLYFLASSFSDIWRRINIYWKDFMLKFFFYPAFFQTRRLGNAAGLLLAVMWVFLWTWLAHSWQVFWLLGTFPFRASDAALWASVGALVAVNSLLDYRRATVVQPPSEHFDLSKAVWHAVQVIGVFACVSVFWAHWSNPEVLKLLLFSTYLITWTVTDALVLGGTGLAAVAIGVLGQYVAYLSKTSKSAAAVVAFLDGKRQLPFEQSVGFHLTPMVVLLLLAQTPVTDLLGGHVASVLRELQIDKLSRGDAMAMIDGYYEELNDQSLQSGPFLGDPRKKRTDAAVDFGDLIQPRMDILEHDLVPGWKGTLAGAATSINRWGMRDGDRTLAKPADTYRIAVVGSSVVMGYGLRDDETFPAVLEQRMNQQFATDSRHFEVLNFGVGRYAPLHRRILIESKVLAFAPDLILYIAHQDEVYGSTRRVAAAYSHRLDLKDPDLDALIAEAGVTETTSEPMVQIILERHHAEILKAIYQRLRLESDKAHAKLLLVYVPIPGNHDLPFDARICMTIAEEAGIRSIDLSEWWGDRNPEEVLLRSRDLHGNSLGNQLIAERVLEVLRGEIPLE